MATDIFSRPRQKRYDENLDRKFLKAMDVKIIEKQPWQFNLLHPDLEGSYTWYPDKGTLMFNIDGGSSIVGTTHDSEHVFKLIMERIIRQQNGQ